MEKLSKHENFSLLSEIEQKYHIGQFENTYRSTIMLCDYLEENKVFQNNFNKENGSVLDVATGTGSHIAYMINRFPDYHYIGFDINEKLIRLGREIFKMKNITKGDLYVDNIYDLFELKYGNIQIITCFQTLSWLPNYETAIEKLSSLSADYMAFSSLFYDGPLDYRIEVKDISGKSIPNDNLAYYNVISIDKIKVLLHKLGYEIKYKQFIIDIDLPKPKESVLGTYTQKLEDGTRLQISGGLMMPWYFLLASKHK